jgi:hypothetical protein
VPRHPCNAGKLGERAPEVGSEGMLIQVASQRRIIKIAAWGPRFPKTGQEGIRFGRGLARVETTVSQQLRRLLATPETTTNGKILC